MDEMFTYIFGNMLKTENAIVIIRKILKRQNKICATLFLSNILLLAITGLTDQKIRKIRKEIEDIKAVRGE